MKALIVGGTGPTGPGLVDGLQRRGYDVAILHRGVHETSDLADVEHIHCDPHFEQPLVDGLRGRTFDLAIAAYGRTRIVARVLAGRCERLIGIGGVPVYFGNVEPAAARPFGLPLLVGEEAPLAGDVPTSSSDGVSRAAQFAAKLAQTEKAVFELHRRGAFVATWFRYPSLYGPRVPTPWEWSIVKRIDDARPYIILPDGGLSIRARMSTRNAVHCVLLAVDQPEAAGGHVFNCADDQQYTLRQWVELVADACGGSLEVVALPLAAAGPALSMLTAQGTGSPHVLLSTRKVRQVLGYRDAVAPRDAIAELVAWYREHPVTAEGYPLFRDTFPYALEDRLVRTYREMLEALTARVGVPDSDRFRHSYAHPKQQGVPDELGR